MKRSAQLEKLTQGSFIISLFAHELAFQNSDSRSLPFLQEMKASTFQVPACLALGLTKPAASAMRAAVENGLYYSYFKDHPMELQTLVDRPSYYLSKHKIIEYHKLHTDRFGKHADAVGFIASLDNWYSKISAIVHGQIPGVWSSKSLAETGSDGATTAEAVKIFEQSVKIVRYLFLLTTPADDWEAISPRARTLFLKSVPAAHKDVLGLATV